MNESTHEVVVVTLNRNSHSRKRSQAKEVSRRLGATSFFRTLIFGYRYDINIIESAFEN